VPIRADPCSIPRELVLPESVARELRPVLKQTDQADGGVLTEDTLARLRQELDAASGGGVRDGNDDNVAHLGECEIVADGGALLAVVLDGLRVRLAHPIDRDEKLRFTGER
jgi:hypothetical protein